MIRARSFHRVRCCSGFTIMEMVAAMVITGILAGMMLNFLSGPVKGYLNTVARGDLTDAADMSLRRVSRELRQALPNSLRMTQSGGYLYIEFIATSGGGAYHDVMDGVAGGNILNFSDGVTTCSATAGKCQFDVTGAAPSNPPIAVGDYVVVYNLGQDSLGNSYSPADAYASGDPCTKCNRAKVSAVVTAGATTTVTLAANAADVNVFAAQVPPMLSPSNRFHVVPGGTQAVTFACPTVVPGPFYRYVDYGFFSTSSASIAALGSGSRSLLANTALCSATYTAHASQRNGLLVLTLTLQATGADKVAESATLRREIHLDNSP